MIEAWARWDEKPSDEHRARTMEDEAAKVAASIGVTTSDLRARLAAARRAGLSRVDALKGVT